MPGLRLSGKTAIITGASRNIGAATALAFAQEGCNLALNANESREELDAVAERCRSFGVEAISAPADIGDGEEATRMANEVLEHFGKVDILASIAAVRPHKSVATVSVEEYRRVMSVNLDATFYLAHTIVPRMIELGTGSIVTVAQDIIHPWSAGGPPFLSAASKFGLLGLVRGLAVELGCHGIRVNAVGPGPIDTERRHPEWYPEMPDGSLSQEGFLKQIPMRRLGRSEEVASAILFLASDEASYITGAWLPCSGGYYM